VMLRAVELLASVGLPVAVASSVLLFSWGPSAGPQEARAATGRPRQAQLRVHFIRRVLRSSGAARLNRSCGWCVDTGIG
jgi:hypothetical protein